MRRTAPRQACSESHRRREEASRKGVRVKTLVLHIGANKTGSTAIQEFLRLNAAALHAFGYVVAPTDLTRGGEVTGHHIWHIEQLRADIPTGRERLTKQIHELMRTLGEDKHLVLSAENLANPDGAEQMFSEVASQYDTRVILYIRRQDELLLSSWQQWESKIDDDFWAWLVLGVGVRGDWAQVLQAWERVVPRAQITVRLYERARMPEGDIVLDFAHLLGLSDRLSDLRRPRADVNPSYSDALVDLVKGSASVFADRHDNTFYNMVEQLTGNAYHRRPRESVITHAQRAAILDRYRASNEWVCANYFPEMAGNLFPQPGPDDYLVLGQDKLEEQKWEIVATLIFKLAARVLRR